MCGEFKKISLFLTSFCFFALPFFIGYLNVSAETTGQLQEKILEKSNEVKELEKEIEKYQEELSNIAGQARTLNTAIKTLDITTKKLNVDIQVTDRNINKAALTIDALTLEIKKTKEQIQKNTAALGEIIRELHNLESRSFVEVFLAHTSFSAFWSSVESLEQLQNSVGQSLETLVVLKKEFEEQKSASLSEKEKLVTFNERLESQRKIAEVTKSEKNRLLEETKNRESNYKDVLEERLAQKEALEIEIKDFEEELRFELDPSALPETGSGVLSWPLEKIRVTQFFGNTPFATKNPQVYNGAGHNGVDFGAAIGTPIYSSARGVVIDTGDTDTQCYKVSYGKWVLVRHFNGLTTLYAHLSLISVSPGQEIGARELVGYSGNTGYTTGPHLHFAVFASEAVQVTDRYKSRVCGTNLKLPLSARSGYLNPLSYLPELP